MWKPVRLIQTRSIECNLNCSFHCRCTTVAVQLSALIAFCLVGTARSQQCRTGNFNGSSLSSVCGYNNTVKFQHESHFNMSLRRLAILIPRLESCSKYSKLMLCSLDLPRCKEDLAGPYLPCKRVCDEYIKSCTGTLIKHGIYWWAPLCQLLPEVDDPRTTKGYLGRCFEPPNFKPSAGKNYIGFHNNCWRSKREVDKSAESRLPSSLFFTILLNLEHWNPKQS